MTVVPIGRGDDRLAMARRRIVAAVTQADLPPMSPLAEVLELAGRLTEQPAPNVVISCAAVIGPVTDRTSEGLLRTLVTRLRGKLRTSGAVTF
jgi:hypothetical protein